MLLTLFSLNMCYVSVHVYLCRHYVEIIPDIILVAFRLAIHVVLYAHECLKSWLSYNFKPKIKVRFAVELSVFRRELFTNGIMLYLKIDKLNFLVLFM